MILYFERTDAEFNSNSTQKGQMVPLALVSNITALESSLEAFMQLNNDQTAKNQNDRDKMQIFTICSATVTRMSKSTPKLSKTKIQVFPNRMTP